LYLSSKNIMDLFTVDGYYNPLWDRVYENKANDNTIGQVFPKGKVEVEIGL